MGATWNMPIGFIIETSNFFCTVFEFCIALHFLRVGHVRSPMKSAIGKALCVLCDSPVKLGETRI